MNDNKNRKQCPKEWARYFELAKIRTDELNDCKSSRARAIKIGQFLSPNVDREVPIDVNGRTGTAILRVEGGRAKEKRYFFLITWDDVVGNGSTASAPNKGKKRPKGPPKKRPQARRNKTRKATARQAKPRSSSHSAGNSEAW